MNTSILVPSYRTGKVHLYQLPSPGHPKGRLFPVDFSRPNSAEDASKSGTMAINSDGTYRTLGANIADLSHVGGKCVLRVPPQRKNIIIDPTAASNFIQQGGTNPATITTGVNDGKGGTKAVKIGIDTSDANINKRFRFICTSEPNSANSKTYACSFWAKCNNASAQFAVDPGNNNRGQNFTFTSSWQKYSFIPVFNNEVKEDFFDFELNNRAALAGAFVELEIAFPQVEVGPYVSPEIPNTGTALTRNAPSIIFDDLVNKGVTSAAGFSLIFDFANYRHENTNTISWLFRNGSTNIFSMFYAREDGLTLFDNAATYLDYGKKAKNQKAVITYEVATKKVRFYYTGAKQIDYTFPGAVSAINQLNFNHSLAFFELGEFVLLFEPLSEAQAINEFS